MNREDYFTPEEASEVMMCSSAHIRNLVRNRVLPVYRVGRRLFIPKEAVLEYIASQTHLVESYSIEGKTK